MFFFIAGGGYFGYKKFTATSAEVRYVVASVTKGAVIASVSGSGQVSVVDQADMKSKVSGEIVALPARLEQNVVSGTLLASIDARDAVRAVRDAETSLETAKLDLDKLLQPADELTLFQSEGSLIQAQESKKKAEDDLSKAYEDGFNAVTNAFLELPGIMTGLNTMLFGSTLNKDQWNVDYYVNAVQDIDLKIVQYKSEVSKAYQDARVAYDKNFDDYKVAGRFSERSIIESLVNETYETTKSIAEAIKDANNFIQFYQDKLAERSTKPNALSTTHLADLNTYTGKVNGYIGSLLSIRRTIQSSKDTIVSTSRSITEKNLSLAKIKASPDALDIRARKIAIQSKEAALLTAREALLDYTVRAPFSGIISKVNVKKGDTVSSGTVLATLITQQKIAKISLNEIDVAKVKVGQKATLTFDAVSGLSITGAVMEIDALGTVSQGVVTYTLTIGFDTQDERVKSGMSLSAAIVTDMKQDVLTVPAGAVKTQGGVSVVEIFDTPLPNGQGNQGVPSAVLPKSRVVETGLSNDTSVEIIFGLNEGDQVITRTITAGAKTTTPQAPSLFGGAGGGNRGGGGFQVPRN
ncbi:MAG: efflux RND transporter periplasmic adaptor subunit [bacterium]|nr:efflux RND transporter periplasmic adaptor subunit [bacterium]